MSQAGHPAHVVRQAERMQPGHVHIAPADRSLLVSAEGLLSISDEPAKIVPSVDRLFETAASFAPDVVAVLLTGMGEDGARGLERLRRAGALTITQARQTCAVDGMPGTARALGASMLELEAAEIAKVLTERLATALPLTIPHCDAR